MRKIPLRLRRRSILIADVFSDSRLNGRDSGFAGKFEIKHQIDAYHQQIERVKRYHPVAGKKDFVHDPAYVSQHHDYHKNPAFSGHNPGPQGFCDGNRPTDAETQEHRRFKNAR
jgi:hypothetical protein